MNLRINNEMLRFRISKQELELLLNGEKIAQYIDIPQNNNSWQRLNIQIIPIRELTNNVAGNDKSLDICYEGNDITLYIQQHKAKQLYDSLPQRDGISRVYEFDNKKRISINLEVDIRTQKRRFNS